MLKRDKLSLDLFWIKDKNLTDTDSLPPEVLATEIADDLEAALEQAAGVALRHRATRYESVESAMKAHSSAPRMRPEARVPTAAAARLLTEFKDRHCRAWLDVPLPALGGRTPRHAARLKTLRPRPIDLSKEMENHEARTATSESPAYDFGWIWRELGLD